jgi:hypothetical protein
MKNLTILFAFLFIFQQNLMAQEPKHIEPQSHAYQIYKQSIKNGASDRDRYIWVQDSIWFIGKYSDQPQNSNFNAKYYNENDDLGRIIVNRSSVIYRQYSSNIDTSFERTTYTYSGDFRTPVTQQSDIWKHGEWEKIGLIFNKIDENDNLTERIYTSWNSMSNEWVKVYKIDYTHFSYSKLMTEIRYSWINESWKTTSKENKTYNHVGNLTSSSLLYLSPETQFVTDGSKSEWIYDENYNLLFWNNYEYDTPSSSFKLIQKDTFYYQSNSNKIAYSKGVYLNNFLNEWFPNGKNSYTYDNNEVINNVFYFNTESQMYRQDSFYTGEMIFGNNTFKYYQFESRHSPVTDTFMLVQNTERLYDSLPDGRAYLKNIGYSVIGDFNTYIFDEDSWYHIKTIPFPSPENTNSSPICMMTNPYILGSNIYCESEGAKLMRVYDLYGREIAEQAMESGITSLLSLSTTPDGFYVLCTYDAAGKQLGRQKFVINR